MIKYRPQVQRVYANIEFYFYDLPISFIFWINIYGQCHNNFISFGIDT